MISVIISFISSFLSKSGLLRIGLVSVLIGILGAGYWHYTSILDDRTEALAQVREVEIVKKIQEKTINDLTIALNKEREKMREFQEVLTELATVQKNANKEARRLNDVLSKHDLNALSLAKPGLIENRINAGTADILRMFEQTTTGGSDNNAP